jgi:hypothetical protein
VPVLVAVEGLWPPCALPWAPDCDEGPAAPPSLEEEVEEEDVEDELLPDVEDVDEGVLPVDPDEPWLLLGDELGTGMPVGLGWVMTVCSRQPHNSSAQGSVAAAMRAVQTIPGRVRP